MEKCMAFIKFKDGSIINIDFIVSVTPYRNDNHGIRVVINYGKSGEYMLLIRFDTVKELDNSLFEIEKALFDSSCVTNPTDKPPLKTLQGNEQWVDVKGSR